MHGVRFMREYGGLTNSPCQVTYIPGEPPRVAAASSEQICLWDAGSPRPHVLPLPASIRSDPILAVSPDGRWLASGADDIDRDAGEQGLYLSDTRTGRTEPVPFADGARMPLRGGMHRVCFTGPRRARGVVEIEHADGGLPILKVSGRLEHAPRRMKDWLVEQARADLDASVTRHSRTLNVKARSISVRDQTSRWGSCTAGGLLSFSWRLVMAPGHVLDYVAAHEVAHLLEMNHGPRFWKHVARCMPRLEEAKRWLRSHGADLHRYGATP